MSTGSTMPREAHLYLWLLAGGPAVWTAHFFLTYITAAVWCAKFAGPDGTLARARVAIAWYTVIALAAIVAVAISGYRRHGRGFEASEHGLDSGDDRDRFLGFATLLLAALSAVATIYVATAAVLVPRCF